MIVLFDAIRSGACSFLCEYCRYFLHGHLPVQKMLQW